MRFPKLQSISIEERAALVVEWILRAQLATLDDGVSESYKLVTDSWNPSYPETTGYIIGSLLRAADAGICDQHKIEDAVGRMANWLVSVQLANGAFPGGNVARENPQPAVFNTGQILFGLTELLRRGYDHTAQLSRSARRAAEWMQEVQDADGAWRSGVSDLTNEPLHSYNVRAAWGLAKYGATLGDQNAIDAATSNAVWVQSVQDQSGWFAHMNFNQGQPPLLHTIVYTVRGLLEIGALSSDAKCIESATFSARKLIARQSDTGAFPGQFAVGFAPSSRWTSFPGNCQMAVLCYRLAEIHGDSNWRENGKQALDYCCGFQEVDQTNSGRRGALRGSYPGHRGYGKYWYMNWTQKFFLDALLADMGMRIDNC